MNTHLFFSLSFLSFDSAARFFLTVRTSFVLSFSLYSAATQRPCTGLWNKMILKSIEHLEQP
jgi:hypothetical protein